MSQDTPPPRTAPTLAQQRLAQAEIPSPRELDARLGQLGYKGQERARRAATVLAYRHLQRNRRLHVEGIAPERGVRENALFLGPTGSGKTHLVELLFKTVLDVPTLIVDATQFSETGYVGDDVNTILSRLFEVADADLSWASCGVVCMDEFDKLATSRSDARFAGQQTTKDVSGFGVQRSLLHLLSGQAVDFPPDFGFTSRTPPLTLPMAGITFIACGAFSGLQRTAEGMGGVERLGFGREVRRDEELIAQQLEEKVLENTAAFARYGFIPELIARFNRLVAFTPLAEETLRQILFDNVLGAYVREFAQEGVTLQISDAVLDHVVKQAIRRETGARGLRTAVGQLLEDAAYGLFGSGGPRTARVVLKDERVVVETD